MHHIILHPSDTNSAIHRLLNECPFIANDLIASIKKSTGYLSKNVKVNFSVVDNEISSQSADMVSLSESDTIKLRTKGLPKEEKVLLANARYIPCFDHNVIQKIIEKADADIICIETDHNLCGFREKVTFDSTGNIVGLRRIFSNSIIPSSVPENWPEMVFISPNAITKENGLQNIPVCFSDFISKCNRKSLTIRCVRIAGINHDLYNANELLSFMEKALPIQAKSKANTSNIAQSAKLIGKVILGSNVKIGEDCIIVGPAIIGDNIVLAPDTVVRNSILGNSVKINDKIIEHSFISNDSERPVEKAHYVPKIKVKQNSYKSWPIFSYAGIWKRLADIIFASFILLMSLPVFAIVAVAIKYASPGPIFFQHKRQGLHGKPFGCIKFRTMIIGADDIQDQLRKINEVDGPQFKMEDDPRVNSIGKFLRDTCIDEIPQFINVLLGQMSVIGPRPSPEKENAFCAYWRDARLSVRPGITGLWQIKRTRQEGQDFQEWVIHDTAYVKHISFLNDIKICLLTVKHIVKSFIEQF